MPPTAALQAGDILPPPAGEAGDSEGGVQVLYHLIQ